MGRKKKTKEEYEAEWMGRVFSDVMVCEYSHNKDGKAYFWCRCLVCGEMFGPVRLKDVKSGHTKSCGHCLERTEIGKRYGHYVIREYHHRDKESHLYFLCDCDCGEEGVVVRLGHLKSGATTSCGHCSERTEIGNKYGHWVVKEFHHRDEKTGMLYFLCDCDCGEEGVVRLSSLKSGASTSCGCVTESIGETNIKNILDENNISYESQKRFEDCKNINTLPFDFYITHDGRSWCVEFDGPQHEKVGWGDEEKFKQTQQNDQIKNQYCKDNGIPLIRIPYNKRDTMTIDDLMLGSNYLLI